MMKIVLMGMMIFVLSFFILIVYVEDLVVGMFGGNFVKVVMQCYVQFYEVVIGDMVILQEGSFL